MVVSFSVLLPSQFTPAIQYFGRGARADTVAPRVLQAIPAVPGIREFSLREPCSLTPSTLLGHFRTTAPRMEPAAVW